MKTINQKGFTSFTLVLLGFTVAVGVWFVYQNYFKAVPAPGDVPAPMKTQSQSAASDSEKASPISSVSDLQSNPQDQVQWKKYQNQPYGYVL